MINWSYVAGFMDGEGHVDTSTLRITIVQKDRVPLDKIADFLNTQGIRTQITHRTSQYRNKGLEYGKRNLHALRVNRADDVLKFCRACLPYSIVKKQKMEDVVRFRVWLPLYTQSQKGKLRWEATLRNGNAHKSLANLTFNQQRSA